jgi:hypothetical protein
MMAKTCERKEERQREFKLGLDYHQSTFDSFEREGNFTGKISVTKQSSWSSGIMHTIKLPFQEMMTGNNERNWC